jgi:hypothetical protein
MVEFGYHGNQNFTLTLASVPFQEFACPPRSSYRSYECDVGFSDMMYMSNIKICPADGQTRPPYKEFFSCLQRAHNIINYSFRLTTHASFFSFGRHIFTGSTAPLGPGLCFQFHDHFTDSRTPWASDQLVARPLPKHRINIYTHETSIPCVGFESTIPASERAKTVHALDRSATVTGSEGTTEQKKR